ncbi:MAG: hypothetical protein M3Y65_25025 [Pseudomonadota bacterium]|nr:hypothetical protein [Pseudomonadota bacterium]
MNFYDEMDRYLAQAEMDQATLAGAEVHSDADLGLPEGALAAHDATVQGDDQESSDANL